MHLFFHQRQQIKYWPIYNTLHHFGLFGFFRFKVETFDTNCINTTMYLLENTINPLLKCYLFINESMYELFYN
jgi:hypothetical protein